MGKVYYKTHVEEELILLDIIFLNCYKDKTLHFDGSFFKQSDLENVPKEFNYDEYEYSKNLSFDIDEIREKNDVFYIKLKNGDICEISVSFLGYGNIAQRMIIHKKKLIDNIFFKRVNQSYLDIYKKFLASNSLL